MRYSLVAKNWEDEHMASKWRPSIKESCHYVIPDIRGNVKLLNKILKRILPLRKSDGIKDKIIFLGNYINYHQDSHLVLDRLIDLKKGFKDNVIFLFGENELLFLEAMELISIDPELANKKRKIWFANGGYHTVLGYFHRAGIDENPSSFSKDRILNLIPKEHIEFLLTELVPYFELNNKFILVHSGFDSSKHVKDCLLDDLVSNKSLINEVTDYIKSRQEFEFSRTIVTGHHSIFSRGNPIFRDKYMMLDCGAPKRLLVTEVNTRESFMAYPDKDRLVEYKIRETFKPSGVRKKA